MRHTVVENNNLVFKTFDEAKRYLIANPGGSIVRLDSNAGFYINFPNQKLDTKSKTQDVKDGDKAPAISSPSWRTSSPTPTDTTKRRTIRHKKKPLSSKNLPKSRTPQHTSSSRGVPGQPRVTHVPKQTDDYPKQYIDEPLGTREEHYKMKSRQGFKNKTGNH